MEIIGSLTNDTRASLDEWKHVKQIFASCNIHGITQNGEVISTLLGKEKIKEDSAIQVLSIENTLYILTKEGKVFCKLLDTSASFWMPLSDVAQIVDDSAFLALKKNGLVNSSFSYHDSWSDIVAVTANYGVKSDGTIIATQENSLSQEVCSWKVFLE